MHVHMEVRRQSVRVNSLLPSCGSDWQAGSSVFICWGISGPLNPSFSLSDAWHCFYVREEILSRCFVSSSWVTTIVPRDGLESFRTLLNVLCKLYLERGKMYFPLTLPLVDYFISLSPNRCRFLLLRRLGGLWSHSSDDRQVKLQNS